MSCYPVTLCGLVDGHRHFFFFGLEGVHLKYLVLSPVRSLISKCDEFTCCPNSNGHVTFMQCGVKCFGGLLGRISLTPSAGGAEHNPCHGSVSNVTAL